MNQQNNIEYLQEDEIDLKELFRTIWDKKVFIVVFTFIVTLLAIIYAYTKTPIYEVTAVVEIGSYKDGGEKKLLDEANKLEQELNILYVNILKNEKDRLAWIESISQLKKQNNFLELKAQSISNEEATKEIEKVVLFVTQKHKKFIDDIIDEKKLELDNLSNRITLLKTDSLISINEDIKYTNNTLIPSIEKKIEIITKKLVDMKQQLKLTQLNIEKTQYKEPSLTALNIIEKRTLESEISSLQLQLLELKDKLVYTNEKTLPKLLRNKSKLEDIDLKQLENKLLLLKQNMLPHNYKNSSIVGKIIINDYPVKPKKVLIVVISFVTGFILSIFLVFFMNFISSFKNEEKTKCVE